MLFKILALFKPITRLLELLNKLLESLVKTIETLRKAIEQKLTVQTVNTLAILVSAAIVIFAGQALVVILLNVAGR